MRNTRPLLLVTFILAAALIPSAITAFGKDKVFSLPRAYHAKTYPAHESHDDEKVSIAADPYDMPEKTAGTFMVDYKREGFLPIFLILSNDGDGAVSLADMKVTLVTRKRSKIGPAEPDDIFRRISKQTTRGDEPQRPFPLPKKKSTTISKEARDEVKDSQFMARAVEPHGNQSGFLFFDVGDIDSPLAGAKLVVTGLTDSKGHDLFYFEIPMEKYLSYQPVK
jgi:hypothetical protein